MQGDMKIRLSAKRKEEREKWHDETRDAQIRDRIKALLLALRRMERKNDCRNFKDPMKRQCIVTSMMFKNRTRSTLKRGAQKVIF